MSNKIIMNKSIKPSQERKFKGKSAQDTQDEIFRRMSADRRIEVASQLWRLAKELDHEKIDYRISRPSATARKSR